MKTFLKAQAAAVASTAADFLMTVLLVELFQCPIVVAGVVGNVLGAIVNFMTGRNWVFDSSDKKISFQAIKYLLVWVGYTILMAAGMMAMGHFTSIHYIISKSIVGIFIGFTYGYFLQKKFVFI